MTIQIRSTKRFRVLEKQQQQECHIPHHGSSLDWDFVSPTVGNGICSLAAQPLEQLPQQQQLLPPMVDTPTSAHYFDLPVFSLYDVLEAHGSLRRKSLACCSNRLESTLVQNVSCMIQHQLYVALKRYGFVLIKVSSGRAATTIQHLRTSLQNDFFPISTTTANTSTTNENTLPKKHNLGGLLTSSTIYVSERGIPMYKLGYELCDDNVREVFRFAAGEDTTTLLLPDDDSFPLPKMRQQTCHSNDYDNGSSSNYKKGQITTKSIWTRGIGLLRHVTDSILDLLLLEQQQQQMTTSPTTKLNDTCCIDSGSENNTSPPQRMQNRPYSGTRSWWDIPVEPTAQNDRIGDFSVLYAMHYFNDGKMVEPGVSVKEHVDPSLLVVEPFLCPTSTGLQVWDRINNGNSNGNSWIDCDGPSSPMYSLAMDALRNKDELMLLFAGKALSEAIPSIPPTLHRVVTGHQPRHTIIYEQKYAEFYPTPTFD